MFRQLASLVMLAVFPVSLMATDTGGAMMYVKGTAWVNGSSVMQSSAVFPGDLVQTKPASFAKINALGSSVSVLSDSTVKFENNAVALDHGSVAVGTSKSLTTRAGEVTVAPAANSWTEFEVHDNNGTVQILAHKGSLNVSDAKGTVTLPEGQQTTRYASSDRKGGGAAPAAGGGILDSPILIGVGLAAVVGLVTWVLLQDSKAASPSQP